MVHPVDKRKRVWRPLATPGPAVRTRTGAFANSRTAAWAVSGAAVANCSNKGVNGIPEFVRRVRDTATPFTLAEGQALTLSLTLTGIQ